VINERGNSEEFRSRACSFFWEGVEGTFANIEKITPENSATPTALRKGQIRGDHRLQIGKNNYQKTTRKEKIDQRARKKKPQKKRIVSSAAKGLVWK